MTAGKLKPNGEPTEELLRLRAASHATHERLTQLERDMQDAAARLVAAGDRVTQLERRAANGETVTDEERREAEADLETAVARHREPWNERSAGVRAAIRDADQAVQGYIAENFDALLAVVHENADQAAADVDAAARRLTEAIGERARVERAVIALASTVRRGPDVQRSRTEQLARELERLAMAGGELAPRLRIQHLASQPESEHPGVRQPEPEPLAAA